MWTELAWSPDTRTWNRIEPGKPLIRGSDEPLDYDYGCVYLCAYPVFLENEIRLYDAGSDYLHFGWRNGSLCLATLRPDGFASIEPASTGQPAMITTNSFPFSGQSLSITADVWDGGSIKADIIDTRDNVIATAKSVSTTVTNEKLLFSAEINTDEIRIRFVLENAKLYSFASPSR